MAAINITATAAGSISVRNSSRAWPCRMISTSLEKFLPKNLLRQRTVVWRGSFYEKVCH
ncbi:hypothetical protein [Methylobacillus sp. MM3]|uniref:hypothetical protein n=1 Tax=Methylobacillus sp. MM3 TaxID=1848039 RepID=UPI0013F4E291|nr:hypothetical protein [Methylobacillus sp. MM3]